MALKLNGSWIWTSEKTEDRNAFARFRRTFDYSGGPAVIRITADSRYVLYINGEYIGQGPVREWPAHWRYDEYDIGPYLRQGDNAVAVLVNSFGEGNFQYIPAPKGLLAEIETSEGIIVTDSEWLAMPDPSFFSSVPRIDSQEGFEEQFDARFDDGWTKPNYNGQNWPKAAELRPAIDGFHGVLEEREIPFLTLEPVLPKRLVESDLVTSIPYIFTVSPKPYIVPGDVSSNIIYDHAYLATQIWSPAEAEIKAVFVYNAMSRIKLNGVLQEQDILKLKSGWNSLVIRINGGHCPEMILCFDGPEGLRFSCTGKENGPEWAVVGPFGLTDVDLRNIKYDMGDSYIAVNPADPSCETGFAFWESGDVSSVVEKPFFQPIDEAHLPQTNVFFQAYTDKTADGNVKIDEKDCLISGNGWTTIYPDPNGNDVRILLDFGKEVIGHHRFEIVAEAGTIVDFYNFEFIQPDGRKNLAEWMNNSFRYICRDGRQVYQTNQRRGFQYSYVIFRNMKQPVKLKGIQVLMSTYPQTGRGSFACSDSLLDRIWEVGAHTLRCCAEDTYTDCPTYEQTNWVGDARNEALIDWVINGDPRLWYRCLEQTGRSLERSKITESNVPAAWINILPVWSFLWMRSCREYFLFTGDKPKSRKLLDYVKQNIDGMLSYIGENGLINIRGWNMFDWAAMDTPSIGIVTHLNCFAALALKDGAELADMLGTKDGDAWRNEAKKLSKAINTYLWNDEKAAYTDCMRGDVQSSVFSQQTQTAAYLSGVAEGERTTRCRNIMHNPPDGFVKAGSPFFEFFLLEAFQDENRVQEFLDTIRKDWGFMVDMGATTFWEAWSGVGPDGRLTRSHCHGWSAAPTYFLSTYVLGVRPGGPGFSPAIIEPHPGDLTWCRGTVPTPLGDVEVQWQNEAGKPFEININAPKELELKVNLPREGKISINGVVTGA
ncbi:MAG: family 78 glycoside hydrolase catalytic domain [Armatimonadota bacterium]